jgi:hypothetical protein
MRRKRTSSKARLDRLRGAWSPTRGKTGSVEAKPLVRSATKVPQGGMGGCRCEESHCKACKVAFVQGLLNNGIEDFLDKWEETNDHEPTFNDFLEHVKSFSK